MKKGIASAVGLGLVSMAILMIHCGDAGQGNEGEIFRGPDSGFDLSQSSAKGPITRLKSKPLNPSHSGDATFKFTCTGGPCTYKCSLDSAGWLKCKSPKTYSSLPDGAHIFKVKAGQEREMGPVAGELWLDHSNRFLDGYFHHQCSCWKILSYRGLDRDRDDYLGRIWQYPRL